MFLTWSIIENIGIIAGITNGSIAACVTIWKSNETVNADLRGLIMIKIHVDVSRTDGLMQPVQEGPLVHVLQF